MSRCSLILLCFVSSLWGYSQTDLKLIVGVMPFTTEVNSKYANVVTTKVEAVFINARRFTIVDRLSLDKVTQELEFQKTEAFLDSKNIAKQGAAVGAQFLITGHIGKLNVYTMKNTDGSINGYKASAAFTLKMITVESTIATEAESFQTKASPLMLSPESAVNEALKSIDEDLNAYIIKQFPLTSKIRKVLATKKEAASMVLIAGGRSFGFKEGDKLAVNKTELIDGKPYPTQIGLIKVAKIAGDDFTECSVTEGGKEILDRVNAGETLMCTLLQK